MVLGKGKRANKNSTPTASRKRKDGKMLWLSLGAIAVVVFFCVFYLSQMFFQTETYYVLNEDVGARVQIQPEQLDPIVVSEGQAPPNALGLADVQTGGLYTQYPIRAGDIISESAVGSLSDIRVGVPDSWVITSFGTSADNAAGGRITRGTHFDIVAIDNTLEEPRAFYLFSNVLALDTTISMDTASSADAVDTEEAYSGMTEQYVVGLRPEEAAFLHLALREYEVILVLSPRENEYQSPDLSRIEGFFDLQDIDGNWTPLEVGTMTDNTFMPVERDEFGRPSGHENFGQSLDENIDISEEDLSSITGREGEQSDLTGPSDPNAGGGNNQEDEEDFPTSFENIENNNN